MCLDISWMHRGQYYRVTKLQKYLLWSFLVMFGTLILNLTSLRGFSSMVSQVDKNLLFPSSKTRVCFFFGTRPEIIKLAPVTQPF